MSINFRRVIGGSLLTAAIAGGLALTAVAPASATTIDTGVTKAAAQGDRVQGPAIFKAFSQSNGEGGWYNVYKTTLVNGNNVPDSEYKLGNSPAFDYPTETWSFAAPGTWGPIMNSAGQCLEVPGGAVVRFTTCTGSSNQEFFIQPPGGTGLAAGQIRTRANSVLQIQLPSTQMRNVGYSSQVIALDLAGLVPVEPEPVDCTAGLTGVISSVDQAGKSAVVSGTGKAGETITVAGSPTGPITVVVGADGKWSTPVAGLATGDNKLTVTSSDNCAPVELSVLIEKLGVPVAHPAAIAGAGVLGLGALLIAGLRRRATTTN